MFFDRCGYRPFLFVRLKDIAKLGRPLDMIERRQVIPAMATYRVSKTKSARWFDLKRKCHLTDSIFVHFDRQIDLDLSAKFALESSKLHSFTTDQLGDPK